MVSEPCRFAVAILWALQPPYDLIFTAERYTERSGHQAEPRNAKMAAAPASRKWRYLQNNANFVTRDVPCRDFPYDAI